MSKVGRPVAGRSRRWIVLGVAVAVVTTAVMLGGPPALYATGLWIDGGSATVTPGFFEDVPEPTGDAADLPVSPEAVATPRTATAVPAASAVASRVASVSRTGLGTTAMTFLDAADGTVVYDENAQQALTPASNMKVLSTLAALEVLGPGTTFTTEVVTSGAGQIVLVGGGDPYLTATTRSDYPERASLEQLAQRTATALKKTGTTTVVLGYDTSLFSGPDWHPDWTDGYSSEVARVVSLAVDGSRTSEGMPVADPVANAVTAFVSALARQGITVTSTAPATASAGATQLASVSSPAVSVIVEQILLHSDNDAAETLARHTALASGQPASFTGAAAAITAVLAKLGLLDSGALIRDGSGLSKSNRVTTGMLARAVRASLHSDAFGAVVSGLPLAGVSGTLQTRYSTNAGRGQVWAKTGFLSGIHGLTGILVTLDGDVLVFSMLVNGQADRGIAQPALDAITSAVVTCGCS